MKRPALNEMTLEEKIGQLLMPSQNMLFTKTVNGVTVQRTKDEIKEILEKYQYGNLWGQGTLRIKGANMAEARDDNSITARELKKFYADISSGVRIPLLIGVDCENGCRLTEEGTSVSGALAIGAADDENLTYELAQAVAREIKATGSNWRWSPVVDMVNRFCGIAFGRTYSDDPDKIVKHAIKAIKGTESERVASTVKHFPGVDPYEIRDSHFTDTIINISLEEWRNTQAKTFKGVIDAGVDSVMVGHSAFPAADDTMINGKYIPSTFSKKIIQGLLREEMGFKGVVITDGIVMASLSALCPYEEMLVRLINAGNDILLGTKAYDGDIVKKAVIDGRIPMERINESAERVLKLKEKIGLFDDISEEEIDINEQALKTRAIDRKIAEKSITLVRDRQKMLPLNKENIKKVTIVCSSHFSETIKEIEVMKQEFEKRGAKVQIIEELTDLETIAKENDLIIYAVYIAPHRPMGMPSLYGEKIETYFRAFTLGKEKSIGVSMGYPYVHFDFMGGADTFLNIYSTNPEALKAFVKALYGEITPTTKSPVDIEPKVRCVYG